MKKLLFVICLCFGGMLAASAQTTAPAETKTETKACCKKDGAKAEASCHSGTASTEASACCTGKHASSKASKKKGTASATSAAAPADKKCEKGDACCSKKKSTSTAK